MLQVTRMELKPRHFQTLKSKKKSGIKKTKNPVVQPYFVLNRLPIRANNNTLTKQHKNNTSLATIILQGRIENIIPVSAVSLLNNPLEHISFIK